MNKIRRFIHQIPNRMFFLYKKKFSETSKRIYIIALHALYHEENEIICDLDSGDIIIHVPDLNYHVVVTGKDIIITNHEFPTLGPVDEAVVDKFIFKARKHISKDRQQAKNEILKNHLNLIAKVTDKVKNSSRKAHLRATVQI